MSDIKMNGFNVEYWNAILLWFQWYTLMPRRFSFQFKTLKSGPRMVWIFSISKNFISIFTLIKSTNFHETFFVIKNNYNTFLCMQIFKIEHQKKIISWSAVKALKRNWHLNRIYLLLYYVLLASNKAFKTFQKM